MIKATRRKASPVFKKLNGKKIKTSKPSKEMEKKQKLLGEREREIKKAQADVKASRIFLSNKENMLQKRHAELKEKEEMFSNFDLSKLTEGEVVKAMDGKVSSQFIKDVVLKNIEMKKKEKHMHEQINDLKSREETLKAEIDNVLKIIEEVQKS